MTSAAPDAGAGIDDPPGNPLFVVTPGGLRPRSLVHELGPGEAVVRRRKRTGRMNRATGKSKMFAENLLAFDLQTPVPNWITFAYWTHEGAGSVVEFRAEFVVPSPPQHTGGQTIFYFIGLQDDPVSSILQPVLQWGGDAGQGWTIASWHVASDGHATRTVAVPVQPGQSLTAVIRQTSVQNSQFNYDCFFENFPATQLPAVLGELKMAVVVLEAYNIATCADYAGSSPLRFANVAISAAAGTLQPVWQPGNRVVDCKQQCIIVPPNPPGASIDLYCKRQ